MINDQKSKIVEAEVMFEYYDIDTNLEGDIFQVKPTPTSFWAEFSFSEFAGYLQDTGRIDYADNDAERIGADRCSYTFREFWRNLVVSGEADTLIRDYAIACNRQAKHEWISDIRAPQPAGPEVPSATSREHAEAEANELPPFHTRSWAQFIDNTESH